MRLLFALTILLAGFSPALAADKLTILLDWFVNPDHAPLIVAEQKGYFADAGLQVTLVPRPIRARRRVLSRPVKATSPFPISPISTFRPKRTCRWSVLPRWSRHHSIRWSCWPTATSRPLPI